MTNSVVILSSPEDGHTEIIDKALRTRFDARSFVLDSALLSNELSISYRPRENALKIISANGDATNIDQDTTCWWRRPSDPEIPSAVKNAEVAAYCRTEYSLATIGALTAACGVIVNNPNDQRIASHKAYQLQRAERIGLKLPETLISSNKEDVLEFINGLDLPVIFKANHSPGWQMVDTRVFSEDMESDLDSIRFAPAIFQAFVELGRDLRVIAIGGQLFSYEAKGDSKVAHSDWRVDATTCWLRTSIPSAYEKKLLQLMLSLGLSYGAIDLREDSNSEIFFLEINPSGQFLFLEENDSLLTDAFCQLLMNVTE